MATTNGWMTKEKLLWWIQHIWNEAENGERRLLVLDHYKPHRAADTQSLVESLNTDLVYIPAGCTSICQPMDVSVNAPFKKKVTDLWVEWRRKPAARTAASNLKQPSRQHVISWVSTAWKELSEDILKRSYLKCGISNAHTRLNSCAL